MKFTKQQIKIAAKLVAEGAGRVLIQRRLNISARAASLLKTQILAGLHDDALIGLEVKKPTPAIKKVKDMVDVDKLTPYEVALETSVSTKQAKTSIAKARGTYNPAEEDLQEAVMRGMNYRLLKEEFGFRNLDDAKEHIAEAFAGSYVAQVNRGSDVILVPIKHSEKDWESLAGPRKDKRFVYYVSPEGDYMHVKIDDDVPGDEIRLYMFTDVHFGSKHHMATEFDYCAKVVAEDKAGFWFDNGDSMENNSRTSAGHPLEQYLSVTEQAEDAVSKYGPIKHKGLFKGKGNHELRSEKLADVNISKLIARFLSMPHFDERAYIDIEWRGQNWTVATNHAWREAIRPEAVVKAVRDTYSELTFPVHFFCSGHNHTAFSAEDNIVHKVPGQGLVSMRYYVINGGSFLKRTGTYAQKFKPTCQDLMFMKFHESGAYDYDRIKMDSK